MGCGLQKGNLPPSRWNPLFLNNSIFIINNNKTNHPFF